MLTIDVRAGFFCTRYASNVLYLSFSFNAR